MRILTWIKPTWDWLHIWNYFWAIKPLLEISQKWETFLFIADYHSLTSIHDKETLLENKENIILQYFALFWIDTNINIFEQSKIQHINDIAWILSSVTPYSLMLRSHAFKDAMVKNHEINMATFNYPILMARDIISYDVDLVPIWKDQIQHLEFARDIAWNFNKIYNKQIFKLPEYFVKEELQVIPWTDGRKMSKSYKNIISIFADEKILKSQIMSIVTDNTPLEAPKNPDNCNVFALIKLFADEHKIQDIRSKYQKWWYWYWHAKLELLDLILNYFEKPRQRYFEFKKDKSKILQKLSEWNKKANEIVRQKFFKIIDTVWLW